MEPPGSVRRLMQSRTGCSARPGGSDPKREMDSIEHLPEDLMPVVAFHGHLCPGILIGYRVVRAAMKRGIVTRAKDEEVVAQVENDSCSVDAVQHMAGCTFGKGNLIFKDYGKQTFTFWNRTLGLDLRIAMKIRPAQLLTEDELEGEQQDVRHIMCRRLLRATEDELFRIGPAQDLRPQRARVLSSVSCRDCGEPMMEARARLHQGNVLCIPCLERRETHEL